MENPPRIWTKNYILLCMSYFFLFFHFFYLITSLPVYIVKIMRYGDTQAGLALSVFTIGAIIIRPVAGIISDRYNQKTILAFILGAFTVVTLLYCFIPGLSLLLLLRFINGLIFGIATTTLSVVITSIIPDQVKGEGLGYFSNFGSLGGVLGPFIALSVLNNYSANILFWIASLLAALAFLCMLATKIPSKDPRLPVAGSSLSWRNFFEPAVIPISLTSALISLTYAGITTFVSLYASSLAIGNYASYFFLLFFFIMIIVRPFTGKLYDRYGAKAVMYPFSFIYMIGLLILSQTTGPVLFISAGIIIAIGYGPLYSTVMTVAFTSGPPERKGVATSTFFLFFDIGMMVGGALLGLIATKSGYHTMYLFTAGVILIAVLIYFLFHHKGRR